MVSHQEGPSLGYLIGQRQIALAEGRAKSIELVYQAEAEGLQRLNEANVSEPVLRLKGLEALKDVADGRATKIYMPSDIASAVSTLGMVGESLGIGDATKIDKTAKAKVKTVTDPCCDDEEKGTATHEVSFASAVINEDVEGRFEP